jgi:hypothetical protein
VTGMGLSKRIKKILVKVSGEDCFVFYESRYDFEIMTQEKICGMVLKKWKIFFLKPVIAPIFSQNADGRKFTK